SSASWDHRFLSVQVRLTNFVSPEGAAAEGDDATRMLDEMEAMIAVDDADGVGAPAPLDWSDELAPTETDDPS
ncbi:MAG: hypothetical protein AAFQ64_20875, partial [Pseudomonadota bacterium]